MASDVSARRYIRHQVRDFLVSGEIKTPEVTLDDARIFTNPVRSFQADRLPIICISTLRESAQRLNEAPVSFARKLLLDVVCYAKVDDTIDDRLDSLAAQVENILFTAFAEGRFLDALGETYLNRLDLTENELALEMAESEIGGVAIRFEMQYDTTHEPMLDDLERFGLTVQAESADRAILTDVQETEGP